MPDPLPITSDRRAQDMNKQSLAVLAGATLALAATAHAAPAVDFSKLGPQQQAHMAKIMAAKQAGINPQYNYDIRPATLKSVKVGKQVKADIKNAQAVVSLLVADNLTGVSEVSVILVSPSGNQYASGSWYADFETTREELQIGVDMSNASENGLWRVHSVTVADANRNATYYDEAALGAMGWTSFTVSGASGDFEGVDVHTGGVNLTPTVSVSTPPRGMLPGASARVGVQLNLVDAGSSGVSTASMQFCREGTYWDCFSMSGSTSVRGKLNLALTLGGEAYSGLVPGNYVPYSLSLQDHAGNYRYLSIDYGDDLNSLLVNPVIVITE
jgi:hypothetical protein